jgi:hypothetical protein
MLAKAAGVSLRSVQRILEAYQLAPHRRHSTPSSNNAMRSTSEASAVSPPAASLSSSAAAAIANHLPVHFRDKQPWRHAACRHQSDDHVLPIRCRFAIREPFGV